MSAAATAAGYLYASGRLRGKGKDGEDSHRDKSGRPHADRAQADRPQIRRKEIRVAALPEVDEYPQPKKERAPVKVAYRTRRWRPDAG